MKYAKHVERIGEKVLVEKTGKKEKLERHKLYGGQY